MFWVYVGLVLWLLPSAALLAIAEVGFMFDHARELRERDEAEQQAAEHARPLGNVSNVVTLDSRRRRVTSLPSGTGWSLPLPSTPSRTPRDRQKGGRS